MAGGGLQAEALPGTPEEKTVAEQHVRLFLEKVAGSSAAATRFPVEAWSQANSLLEGCGRSLSPTLLPPTSRLEGCHRVGEAVHVVTESSHDLLYAKAINVRSRGAVGVLVYPLDGRARRYPLPPKPPLPRSFIDEDWYAARLLSGEESSLAGCRVRIDARAERKRGYSLILEAVRGREDADYTVAVAFNHDYWLGEREEFTYRLRRVAGLLELAAGIEPRTSLRVASVGGTVYGRPGPSSFYWGLGWEKYANLISQLPGKIVALLPAEGPANSTVLPVCRSPGECGRFIRSGAYFFQARGIPVALYNPAKGGADTVKAILSGGEDMLAREGLRLLRSLLSHFTETPYMALTRRSLYKLVRLADTRPEVAAAAAAKVLESLSPLVEAVKREKLIAAPLYAFPHLHREISPGAGEATVYCCSQQLLVNNYSSRIQLLRLIDSEASSAVEGVYNRFA